MSKRAMFTVVATGQTFPVKEDLKSWNFKFDGQRSAWVRKNADPGECSLFRHNVSSGHWEEVDLEFIEEIL